MRDTLNGNWRRDAIIAESQIGPAGYRDSQVKGRVVTTLSPVTRQIGYTKPRPAFEVKQVIDGVVTSVQTYATALDASDDYAMLRAHARRNLHEFLSSSYTE